MNEESNFHFTNTILLYTVPQPQTERTKAHNDNPASVFRRGGVSRPIAIFGIRDWVFNQISTRNLGGLYLGSTSQCMLAFVLISWFDRLRARSNGRRGAGALDGAPALGLGGR